MKVRYTVHSCSPEKVEVDVTHNGKAKKAVVDGMVVELVTEDGGMGHTYRFTPDDDEEMADAVKLFGEGSAIEVTFATAPKKAAKSATKE